MAITVNADAVIKMALNQVGKKCGKTNEYSAELDKVHFYNYPKNGVADSCSIFVDDMVYRNTSPKTAHNARSVLYEPDIDNCGAGCVQSAGYFKSHKAWITSPSSAKKGDKIFFKNSKGIYHTGLVVAVDLDKKKITTVEGNTNGGMVAKKTYSFTNTKIAGFGRPKYSTSPAPTPKPAPTVQKYKVKTNTGAPLALRVAPSKSAVLIVWMPNGSEVSVSGSQNGWSRTTYKGKTGWAFSAYLKKL